MVPPSSIWKRRSSAFFVTVVMTVQLTGVPIPRPDLTAVLGLAALCSLLLACSGESSADNLDDTLMRADTVPAKVASVPAPVPAVVDTFDFEDYPAKDSSAKIRPAPVRLETAQYGQLYRTKIREGAARGPNFAGSYTVITWGCGTSCQILAVVDARTGQLSRQTLQLAQGARYRRNSTLLLADPIDATVQRSSQPCSSCGTPAFYRWTGERFAPLGSGPHPHLGGSRPW
jgi:hypothetical protein